MKEIMQEPEYSPLADDLAALANVQRLRLLHILTEPRYGEEMARALGISRQSVLKHIQKLEERGFVRAFHGRRESGPVVEYQVVPQKLFALGVSVSDMGKLEAHGGPKIRRHDPTIGFAGEPPDPELLPPADRSTHLLLLSGPAAGSRFALPADRDHWTIGRDDDRDLRLNHDPFVSARHAEIRAENGGFDLVDTFSANGTFVNFARLPRGGHVTLAVGDVVRVGRSLLVFQGM